MILVVELLPGVAAQAASFKLNSTDISPDKPLAQDFVYNGLGCTGGNQSPELKWTGVPVGTKSFAVALFDPDALQGRGYWHWLVVNVPAKTRELPRDTGKVDGSKLPKNALQIKNDFRIPGYSGACPPESDAPHGYVMTVYALKVARLTVPPDANAATYLPTIESNALAKTSLTYHFARSASNQKNNAQQNSRNHHP